MSQQQIECKHQRAFAKWFRLQYPPYAKLITLPSFGENIGAKSMCRLKHMGLTPAWPDIFIAVPKRLSDSKPATAFGLFIEMKTQGRKPTKEQLEMHNLLRSQGYQVDVCHSCDEAISVTRGYFYDE